jgi:NADH dehydrogenase [ubiquinone] 1 alpha subcomplex assembly factor 5
MLRACNVPDGMYPSPMIAPFDRNLLRHRRNRAANGLEGFDFLIAEVADRLADRLADVRRAFPLAVDLGCHTGQVGRLLAGRGGIEDLIQVDLAENMARRAGGLAIVADEEAIPFAEGSLDVVLSNLSMHWVNDLPGALIQIRRALKPDGMFLAAMLGTGTLAELQQALSEAEVDEEGGLSPRVSPFADVRDLGDLLGRAGFTLPVADTETITVSYADPMRLMADLHGMGESNVLVERRRTPLRRATLMAAAKYYRDLFSGHDGRIPATFQVVFLTGWAPHADQPKPLQPGSAINRLSEALHTSEVPLGEKAKP